MSLKTTKGVQRLSLKRVTASLKCSDWSVIKVKGQAERSVVKLIANISSLKVMSNRILLFLHRIRIVLVFLPQRVLVSKQSSLPFSVNIKTTANGILLIGSKSPSNENRSAQGIPF